MAAPAEKHHGAVKLGAMQLASGGSAGIVRWHSFFFYARLLCGSFVLIDNLQMIYL